MKSSQRLHATLRQMALVVVILGCIETVSAQSVSASWKAGVAKVKITPAESMWMAGYAGRKEPSKGVLVDLYAKSLALEDAAGKRLVIVTTDLIGIPKVFSAPIRTLQILSTIFFRSHIDRFS